MAAENYTGYLSFYNADPETIKYWRQDISAFAAWIIEQRQAEDWVEPLLNQYLVFYEGDESTQDQKPLGVFKIDSDGNPALAYCKPIKNKYIGRVAARNAQQMMALDMLYDEDMTIKMLSGRFGSGKTFLMSAMAVDMIDKGEFEKIVYIRNNVEVKNSNPIGHLPGTYYEKMLPWLEPLADHLGGHDGLERMMRAGQVEAIHLGFLRGRDLKNSIILCSEIENMTKEHMQLLIGRVGDGSQLWLDGDVKQTDAEVFNRNSGMNTMIDRLKGNKLFGYVKLQKTERSATAALADLLD